MLPTVTINEITMPTTFAFFQPTPGSPNEGYGYCNQNNTATTPNTNEYFTDNSKKNSHLKSIIDFSEQMKQNWFCPRLKINKQKKDT